MKNIQVIDDANNCLFPVYSATEEEFSAVFPDDNDIEFAEDFFLRLGEAKATAILENVWQRLQDKKDIRGIHGTLFYGCLDRKRHFPTKKEAEMVPLPFL